MKAAAMLCFTLLSSVCVTGCMNSASPSPPAWDAAAANAPMIAVTPSSENAAPVAVVTESDSNSNSNSNPWRTTVRARDWKHIVLHHTATRSGSVESIHRTHRQRKDSAGRLWLGIGYHFVIGNGHGMRDGEIQPTFRWKKQLHGAHAGVAEYNQRGIGIVLVGNFEEHPPTAAQIKSARRLVRELRVAYRIAPANIVGHGQINKTACPGKYFSLDRITSNVGAAVRLSATQNDTPLTTADTQDAQ